MVNVSSSAVDELKTAMRGQVLLPGDASFDEARSIWNAMIDRRPAIILRCAGVADVRRGVVHLSARLPMLPDRFVPFY